MKSAAYQQASSVSFSASDNAGPARWSIRKIACSGARTSSDSKRSRFATRCSASAAGSSYEDRRQDHPAAQPGVRLQPHVSKDAHDLREPAPRALSADHPQPSLRHAGAVRLSGPDHADGQPQQHGRRTAGAHHDERAGGDGERHAARANDAARIAGRRAACAAGSMRCSTGVRRPIARRPTRSRSSAISAPTDKPERAWALLCQTLFAANEFMYLR